NHTDCPLTDFRGKTSIFSHPVYLFLRKFSLQDSRGGSLLLLFEMPPQALTVSSHHMPQTKAQRSAMSVNHLRKRERQVQPCWD
ncbi:hypothetical protein, partial [Escherichia albertii]|uniref:hypothetical protein n=1 Tax=Escherichia albertii TaxID=208962 RepID=UPI003078AA5E